MKLESLARMNGFETKGAHSALFDAELTHKVLGLIKNKQQDTWDNFLKTSNKLDTETIIKKEKIITLNEYFYGKSRLYLCAPLHPKFCIHPIYQSPGRYRPSHSQSSVEECGSLGRTCTTA